MRSPPPRRSLFGTSGEPLAESGPLHELAVAGFAYQLVAFHYHPTPDEHDLGGTAHLGPLEEVVIYVRVVRLGGDFHPLLGVEDDDVGVAADRDRPFARVHAEELRRVGRDELYEPVHRDAALPDAEVVEHVQAVLDPRAAVGDLREVVSAKR